MYDKPIIYPGGIITLNDCFIYITVDPSGGGDPDKATARTDMAGWCVAAVTVSNDWLILELKKEHMSDAMFVDKLFELNSKYLPRTIGIEKTPHLKAYLDLQCRIRKQGLPLMELIHKGRPKQVRIRAVRPFLPTTYFPLVESGHIQKTFHNWYTDMEHGDDDLDAFAYLPDIAIAPTETQLRYHREVIKQRVQEILLEGMAGDKSELEFMKKLINKDKLDPTTDMENFWKGQ